MKVSWPLSMREAIAHYYLFEYFQDDLIVVLTNSVPESNGVNSIINGLNEVIPEAKEDLHCRRIRESLYSSNGSKAKVNEELELKQDADILPAEEDLIESKQDEAKVAAEEDKSNQ
ncbi:hypothetical protein HN51_013688 [Arachis hypogaea]